MFGIGVSILLYITEFDIKVFVKYHLDKSTLKNCRQLPKYKLGPYFWNNKSQITPRMCQNIKRNRARVACTLISINK